MSVAPNVNTPQGRAEAAKNAVEQNQTQGQAFNKANQSPNAGSGFGAGRITFDKQGNTLQDGKIVQFAGRQAQENFLAQQGLGNNGVITNQAKFNKADFSGVANYNISGNAYNEPFKNNDQLMLESFLAQSHPNIPPDKPQSLGSSGLVAFSSSGNAGQARLAPDMIYRGSAKEEQVKQREADRASKIYQSNFNKDYFSGGKPEGENPIWVPPLGNQYKNMGQGINNSLVRNSPQEAKAKQTEADRASKLFLPQQPEYGNNQVFITGGPKFPVENIQGGVVTLPPRGPKSYGSDWANAQLGTKQLYSNTPKATSNIPQPKPIPSPITQTQNNNNQSLGNALTSLSNKQTASKNLQQERQFKDYLHQGEKEDATFLIFSGGKQIGQTSGRRSYYDVLAAQKNNKNVSLETTYPKREQELSKAVAKNPDFYLGLSSSYWQALSEKGYYTSRNAPKINSQLTTHFTAQNLGLLQGNLYSELHGGQVSGMSGPIYIAPPEHEVSSFIKMPFVGQKVSNSRVPSTSWSNVAQFYPGFPIVGKLSELTTEGLAQAITKGGIKFGEFKNTYGNKIRSSVQEGAMENQYNFPRPRQTSTDLIRPTNLKELEPVGQQISKQTMGKRPPTALETSLSKEPRVKENPNYTPSAPSKLPVQGRGAFDINFKTNTPVYKSPQEITSNLLSPIEKAGQERYPLMSNTLPKETQPPETEAFNLSGKASGRPPIDRFTKPDTGLSPISRKYFGVQFKGIYPTSYTPPASAFAYKTEKPIVNLGERGDYQDFRFRQFMENANTRSKFGFKIQQKEVTPPEETNPLGRRGKTPVKSSISNDFTFSRAKVVEETTPRYQHEVFSSKGEQLSPSRLFGETKPIGALGKSTGKTKSKLEVNLEPRKDYQDWRFSKWEAKNPKTPSVGDKRFDTFLNKLPKQNQKAAVFSVNKAEPKSKQGFIRTSKNLFEEKPKETPKKEFEFKNIGSKSETVLLRKPLTRKRVMTAQEQQYEYGYEFKPVPSSKSESGLLSGTKSISGIKYNLKLHQGSMLAGINKTLGRTKPQSGYRQTPKQTGRMFLSETQKQSPKQIPKMFQSPRQGTKPKQSQTPKMFTPQQPRQTQPQKPQFPTRMVTTQTLKKPKVAPTPPLFGNYPGGKRSKSKSGPTALYNLSVNNVFTSSFNINVNKNNRVEF